ELNSNHSFGTAVSDKDGNIIIGTWDGWLYIYNAHRKICRAYYNIPGGPVDVPSGKAYRAMLLDSRNTLWIGSKQGLFRVKDSELINNPSPHLEAVSLGDSGTGNISMERTVFAFMEDHNKNIWVGLMS